MVKIKKRVLFRGLRTYKISFTTDRHHAFTSNGEFIRGWSQESVSNIFAIGLNEERCETSTTKKSLDHKNWKVRYFSATECVFEVATLKEMAENI